MGVHVSPIQTPQPPPSPSHPSASSQGTSPEHPVSCIKPGLAICFTYGNIHVSVLVSQIIPRDTYRLKVKGWKKIFHANGDQKKAGVAILISDKIGFEI